MRLSLEHHEVHPDQLKMFQTDKEVLTFKNLKACIDVGRAYFNDDKHKILYTYIAAYRALVQRKQQTFCLGVSTRRAVYVKLDK